MGVGALLTAPKIQLTGKLIFGVSYYNPRSTHWEPIVERFGLDYEIQTGPKLIPKTSILLKTNEEFTDLNLNISNDMVAELISIIHLVLITFY